MEHFKLKFDPVANPEAVVRVPGARFTLLTSRLIRMEYSPNDRFEDRASQAFWYRNQPAPVFEVQDNAGTLEIETDYLIVRYTPMQTGFTRDTLSVEVKSTLVTWHYDDPDPQNLLGTTRTLDAVSGHTPLEQGLMSKAGWTVYDDSDSLVFNETGWLDNREGANLDLYFFGYGHDYNASLQDFFKVAGRVPMLPRWALGNWWSRYWAYTQDELTNLMHEFKQREVPLSVCIVDMDWHITNTGNDCSGWTGYTWNRNLFPNPKGFIDFLHEMGLKTALNLHPAEGIHPHEESYTEFAQFMGVGELKPIAFAIEDKKFTQGYFQHLHHPFEDQGVDFWWMDWQQGRVSGKQGLDPLWWLNHLHFYDLGRKGQKRPFVFSRWGGLGNHRYPIGFSGDTHVDWPSLAYQPYFTATAANVGYGWWSHDIGGHYHGIEDSELYTRWVQFGVFSPILRLHSSKNRFSDRRPWGHGEEVYRITKEAMQLRHALIPYLYSMSWRAWAKGWLPIVPMYHDYPEDSSAYACPNQYTFGSELIAAPNVFPMISDLKLSRQVVWMPPGDSGWFHFFTGEFYPENTWQAIYSKLDEIPVFAKAGAIVPLAPKVQWGGVDNPAELDVYIFPGADNRFELYEDEGEGLAYLQGASSLTTFRQAWHGERQTFTIEKVEGQTGHLPTRRTYRLHFRGIFQPDEIRIVVNTQIQQVQSYYDLDTETLSFADITLTPSDTLSVTLVRSSGSLMSRRDRRLETCQKMVYAFTAESWHKELVYNLLPEIVADVRKLADVSAMLSEHQLRALIEVVVSAGVTIITNASPKQHPIVMWNNRNHPGITYQFSSRIRWKPQSESGVIQVCKVLHTDEMTQWRLNVNYADFMMVMLDHGGYKG